MKTKWFKSLPILSLAAAVAFSSCSNEEEKKNDTQAPDGYGYFSLALGTQAEKTFSRGENDGTAKGTVEENFVEEISIVLYNATTNVVAYNFTYPITNINSAENGLEAFRATTGMATTLGAQPANATDKSYQVVTKAEEVATGNYTMLVFCNPTNAVKTATAVGQPYTNVVWAAKTASSLPNDFGITTELTDRRFLMSNADGPISITPANMHSVPSAAELAPVEVYVDRAVALVEAVKGDNFDSNIAANAAPGTGQKYQSISNISWYVDGLNLQTYWVRQPGFPKGGSGTESSTTRENYYAIDPNMGASGTFDFKSLVTTLSTDYYTFKLAATNTSRDYVPENTMNAGINAVDYGTQVVVKCRIQPLGLASTKNYYSYNGAVFTHEQIMDWLYNGQPVTSSILTKVGMNETGFKAFLLASAWFVDGSAVEPTAYAVASNGLTFHFEQWNVYRVPIKHFQSVSDDAWGHYGVVRNNWYIVTISNITGPGDGGGESYIDAKIIINEWRLRSQDESLGS